LRNLIKIKERERERERERETLFVTSAFVNGVALGALGPEDLFSDLGITGWSLIEARHFLFK
jgi:hypothetical protein